MQNFVDDFGIFFSGIFNPIKTFWNWLITTTLGEIIIFVLLISLFLFLLNQFINFKD